MPASKQRRASKADAPANPDAASSLAEREKANTEMMGAMSLAFLFAFGDAMNSDSRLKKAAKAAQLFLIAVLFIAPVLLMWQHAF